MKRDKRRAFALMLRVEWALTGTMRVGDDGDYVILEAAENEAAQILQRELALAERRGRRQARKRRAV